MSFLNFECEKNYDFRCGEIYITSDGKMDFHCTLCEETYKCFEEYAKHIKDKHCPPALKQQNSQHSKNDALVFVLQDDCCSNCSSLDMEEIYDAYEQFESSNNSLFQSDSKKNSKNFDFKPAAKLSKSAYEDTPPDATSTSTDGNEKIFKCEYCKYSGKDKSNYISHVRRHTGIKRYACTECPKKFFSTCEQKRHIATHTGERPYLCQDCGRAFATKHKLGNHQKRHLNLRDMHCTICPKSFFSKVALQDHMLVHSNDRRFKCDICDATFKRSKALATHKKIHDNKLQYHCKLCPAKFNQNPGLRSHIKTKHAM